MTRPHLTLVPDAAELRRRWDRRAAAITLPADINDHRVTWRRWEPAPLVTHIDPACEHCGDTHSGIASGLITLPARRRRKQPPRQVIRYMAFGCPACGAASVTDMEASGIDTSEVWTNRGQQELF